MAESYLTPYEFGEAELIEKKSRFIARVWPVASEAEAIEHIEAMRKKHYDATHNVYAYIIRENGIMRYSDDGEPSGTSGQPTLNVFRAQNIQNVCCVVTRYFGGTLLGAGGLVRAYSAAAKMGLDAAGIARMDSWVSMLISCPYNAYEKVRSLTEGAGAIIESTDFGSDVCISALIQEDKSSDFEAMLTDKTAGKISPLFGESSFRGIII